MRHKDEVLEQYKLYQKMAANKFGKPIKIVRSDNGGEYKNTDGCVSRRKRNRHGKHRAVHTTTKWKSGEGISDDI